MSKLRPQNISFIHKHIEKIFSFGIIWKKFTHKHLGKDVYIRLLLLKMIKCEETPHYLFYLHFTFLTLHFHNNHILSQSKDVFHRQSVQLNNYMEDYFRSVLHSLIDNKGERAWRKKRVRIFQCIQYLFTIVLQKRTAKLYLYSTVNVKNA